MPLLNAPRRKIDFFVASNIDRTNLYCLVRKTTSKHKYAYREHMKNVHKIEMMPLIKQPKYDPGMKVDNDDPNNTSCGICKLIFKTKRNYHRNMKIHNQVGGSMETLRGRSKVSINVTPYLDNSNNYCKSCNVLFYTQIQLQESS
jgi:hypothetical protein